MGGGVAQAGPGWPRTLNGLEGQKTDASSHPPPPAATSPLLFVRVFCVAVECAAAAACAGKNWAKVFLVQARPG